MSVPVAFALDAPLFLLALLLIPAGVWAIRAARPRRRASALRMPATATLRTIAATQPRYRRWLPPALLALTVALLSVALTRPEVTVLTPEQRSSVMVVFDQSGSMAAEDVAPNRMEAARTAAKDFTRELPDATRLGLIAYSSSITTQQPPTTDRETVLRQLDALLPGGGTFTGDALQAALDTIKADGDANSADGRRPPGAIVLLSDGAPTGGANALDVARDARRQRIPIYTLALGTAEGTVPGRFPGEVLEVPPDPTLMRRIARTSGGTAFAVADAEKLQRVYSGISARVSTEVRPREITAAFAGLGLLTLTLALGLGIRWRSRIG